MAQHGDRHPEDVAEVTMQPIRRYNLDAAILFSDILVIVEAFGMKVTMPGGVGILVPEPLAAPDEVQSRLPVTVDVKEKLGQRWTPVVIDYLSAQVEAGAHMLQVFEAMGMWISRQSFERFALPRLQQVAAGLKAKHPDVPLLVFPRGASYALGALQSAGYDVVTMDTETNAKAARESLDALHSKSSKSSSSAQEDGAASALQGNINPAVLRRHQGGDESKVKVAVTELLEAAGPQRLIANLGEGLMGKEDPVLVAALVDAVHSVSEDMIGNNRQKKSRHE
eukprot:gene8846-25919_t